jgi:hypothetical protein
MLTGKPMPSGRERPDILVSFEQGTTLYYLKTGDREVQIVNREFVMAHIAMASSELAERSGDPKLEMSKAQAKDCLFMIESRMGIEGCDLIADSRIVPIAFQDDKEYCFLRLPIPRISPTQKDLENKIDYAALGPFIDSLRVNMADYDGTDSLMFRRLLSAVGALLWDSEPRREIIYWQGEGGEGKTTFCNFLAHKLGVTALPNIKPKEMTKGPTIACFEGVRMVIAEEVGRTRFLNEELKSITGNRFLTGEAKYEKPRTFRNHSFVWMTSNNQPIIKREASHTERLRWIKSTPRKDGAKRTEQDIFEELEQNWFVIVSVCIMEYFAAGKTIWPLSETEIAELSDSYNLGIDGWILENFEYSQYSFIPNTTFQRMLDSRGEKISLVEAKERFHILQPAICDADAVIITKGDKAKGRVNGLQSRGIKNVGIKKTQIHIWDRFSEQWSKADSND